MVESIITVELIHAQTDHLIRHVVSMTTGSTVEEAIALSGIERELTPGSVDREKLGIHGRKVAPDHRLGNGDRVEIYRNLVLDPMEARRRRARRT
jgi:putative ubiquitin-RnfH superfamily antitoxin RatB of RatAB toxin-antitoxin module